MAAMRPPTKKIVINKLTQKQQQQKTPKNLKSFSLKPIIRIQMNSAGIFTL